MTEPKLPDEPTPFIYLLNRMESAASDVNPHMSGYPRHRKAVLEHVAKVERELTSALALAAEREVEIGRLKKAAIGAGVTLRFGSQIGCDCDPRSDVCNLGRKRTLQTAEFTRCLITASSITNKPD